MDLGLSPMLCNTEAHLWIGGLKTSHRSRTWREEWMPGDLPAPGCGDLTSSCSSSLSSSLTTGLALDPRLGRRRPPLSRSWAFSFRPSLIFTLTERAGEGTRRKRDVSAGPQGILGWM